MDYTAFNLERDCHYCEMCVVWVRIWAWETVAGVIHVCAWVDWGVSCAWVVGGYCYCASDYEWSGLLGSG